MRTAAAIRGTLRPYGMHALLLAYTPLLLVVDGRTASWGSQIALGVLTFLVLAWCIRRLSPADRWSAWICVPVATLFEIFGSLIWGGYTYQLHNVPFYVPPGHALVFVFGITAGALPLLRRHPVLFTRAVLVLATIWVLVGLTVMPLTGHRLDLLGASLLPLFAWCILRSKRPTMFAGIWVAVATLEIAGTLAGAWTWAAVAPWSHLATGNPPSAIAAGYAVIDGTVALVAALAGAWWQTRRRSAVLEAGTEPV